jgi:hypothetical protein
MQDQLTCFLRKYWAAPFQIPISMYADKTLLHVEVIILHRVSLLKKISLINPHKIFPHAHNGEISCYVKKRKKKT